MRDYPAGMKEYLTLIKLHPTSSCSGAHGRVKAWYDPPNYPDKDAVSRKLIVLGPCPHDNNYHHYTITPLGLIALMILNIGDINVQSMTQG